MRGAEEEHQSEDVVPQTGLPEPSLGYPVLFCVKLTDEASPTSLVYSIYTGGRFCVGRTRKRKKTYLVIEIWKEREGKLQARGRRREKKVRTLERKGQDLSQTEERR